MWWKMKVCKRKTTEKAKILAVSTTGKGDNPTYIHLFSSWWFQPIWKICSSNWIISPGKGENKKCLKPPPSFASKRWAINKRSLRSYNPRLKESDRSFWHQLGNGEKKTARIGNNDQQPTTNKQPELQNIVTLFLNHLLKKPPTSQIFHWGSFWHESMIVASATSSEPTFKGGYVIVPWRVKLMSLRNWVLHVRKNVIKIMYNKSWNGKKPLVAKIEQD